MLVNISTFAWFGIAGVTATMSKPTDQETMTVTRVDHAAGEVEIPMVVTVVDGKANTEKLVLAHYNSSATDGNKKLSSGYIDGGGNFQEETDLSKFSVGAGNTAILYSTLSITYSIDWSVKYVASTTDGWYKSGYAGDFSYDGTLPTHWKTSAGVEYAIGDILSDLSASYVDVGIKQVTDYTRGRLFERYAASTDPNYAYYNETTDVSKDAVASGDLQNYYKTVDNMKLSKTGEGAYDIATGVVTLKTGLFYYIHGERTSGSGAETSDVTAKFEAKVAPHAA